MQIHIIDRSLIERGRAVFEAGLRCGSGRGLSIVPGAIAAAIEHGFTTALDIESAVSLHTRCSRSTVGTVLMTLDAARNANGLWTRNADGEYRLTEEPVRTFTIMAQ
ncbi:hypothetical protein [Sphingomonas sp. 8AM]|uniref:hypothetical protein n=1 Tax=Sphingomonas sp. 8AM TaxID=2653170 RepID=UPI00135B06B5|nr:hypothetical protein [Sphingomonas sp. 8AM]